ncbi:MAG TPA: hypothetical protein VG389_11635 [Myxococcota bacterium]|jgi:general secretion pathway protein K|nr:hypothetical protein [Myxococcota bacterium]
MIAAALRAAWRTLNTPLTLRGLGLGRGAERGAPARPRQRGIALVMVMIVVTVLTAVLAEFALNTRVNYGMATNLRDDLKAYYLARSGMNLSRVIMHFSTDLNNAISAIPGLPPIPLTLIAGILMEPFNAGSIGGSLGLDLSASVSTEGLGDLDGYFEVAINEECGVNLMPNVTRKPAAVHVLMSLFANAKYNPLFEEMGPDGAAVSREELISSLLDWADRDTTMTDPLNPSAVSGGAGESDPYQLFGTDPYVRKDYPYCSRDEVQLAYGVGDDLWTTLGPAITVFPSDGGAGKVNINCASPEMVRALLCEAVSEEADYNNYCLGPDPTIMNQCTAAFLTVLQFQRMGRVSDIVGAFNAGQEIYGCPIISATKLAPILSFTSDIYTITSEATSGRAVSRITFTVDSSKTAADDRSRGAILYYREE